MRFHLKFLLPLISVLVLAGCAKVMVKEVDYADVALLKLTELLKG